MSQIVEGKLNGVYFIDEYLRPKRMTQFIPVDLWYPQAMNEVYVNCMPGYFIAPLSVFFNIGLNVSKDIDKFILSTKKCYKSAAIRSHLYQYINYFINFYDDTKEYLAVLLAIKTRIDRVANGNNGNNSIVNPADPYPVNMFFYDMERYILKSNICKNVKQMVEDNYYQELNYTNIKSPSLQYTNEHAKLLHTMSILMDLCIPLLTTYAYMYNVENIDDYLMAFYDRIFNIDPNMNMYAKLYETAYTNVAANQKNNQGVWIKQDIRAIDITTHSVDSVANIILNIMPKYSFEKNIISFNYASIRKNTSYKITDISYEYTFVPISSSKRDNDSVSDFDKFEANLIRMNEGLYLQNKINADVCMRNIENQFGPFDPKEIELYTNALLLDENGNYVMDAFQKQLIFAMFFKWFNDTQSIRSINNREKYIELIIAAKKILRGMNMIILPYIIAGKTEKLVQRKTVNKRERLLIEASPMYPKIREKYKNDDIIDNILSIIATIISSDFTVVDMDPEINGKKIDINTIGIGTIIEEVETFILSA